MSFIKKSTMPLLVKIPDAYTIRKSYVGVDKLIRKEKDRLKRIRLLQIRTDLGSIIKML